MTYLLSKVEDSKANEAGSYFFKKIFCMFYLVVCLFQQSSNLRNNVSMKSYDLFTSDITLESQEFPTDLKSLSWDHEIQ